MKKRRKTQVQILLFMMLTLLLLTSWTVKHKNDMALTNEDFIRFHVIANSDTEQDQSLKLVVRDRLLASINQDLVDYTVQNTTGQDLDQLSEQEAVKVTLDKEAVEQYIETHLSDIEQEAEAVIMEQGYHYSASAELGVRWIPEKTYGKVTFPAGNYEALNIVIGEGKGQNWWCVLFPPLCLVGVDGPEAEEETPLAGQGIMEAQQQSATGSGSGQRNPTQQELLVAEIYRNAITDKRYESLLELLETSGCKPFEESKDTVALKLRFKTLEMINGKCVGE